MLRRLAVPALIVGMLLVQTAPAYASYDGTDPNSTGCANDAVTEQYITIDQGTTQLRYSANCNTAWARFQCQVGGSGCTEYRIEVFRNNDGLAYVNSVSYPYFTPPNAFLYTLQLDDGPGLTAKACYAAAATNWVYQCSGSFAPIRH